MLRSWYLDSIEKVREKLATDISVGLPSSALADLRKKYGLNKLPEGKKKYWWQILFGQFRSPLVIILLIAASLTLYLAIFVSDGEEFLDFYVIMLAVLVNVSIGFWQEWRSNKIFAKLNQLVQVNAHVRRDGKIFEVEMKELVPGDIILLRSDIKVPADARIVTSRDLKVNESLLTGESGAVNKNAKNISGEVSIGDRFNMVYMGTLIERGEGEAIVVGTGAHTEIGKIASLTADVEEDSTPLQEKMGRLGNIITIFVSIAAVIIAVVGFLRQHDLAEVFTTAVAVAVAAIPEGLPAALSVVLAVAASRVLKKGGLIKKLLGAETLGSTTVIVTDKTGTLTTGKMTVEKIIESRDENQAALGLALSSDIIIVEAKDGTEIVQGETTDQAKVNFFIKKGGNLNEAKENYGSCAILPFNQNKKYIASFHRRENGNYHCFVTGAPETLLLWSTLDDDEKEKIKREVEKYAGSGYRMIAIAEREIKHPEDLNCEDNDTLEKYVENLSFLGVAAMRDPIREDVKESIAITRKANVRVIMATGDHKLTAKAIGRELGFSSDPEKIIDGEELERMSDEEFERRISDVEIFSRVSPEHKMRITKALRRKGEVVAMTGDGVNDAPAIKTADIGISLGSGTDITKEAAELVLMDDSFSIITAAIRQGRIAFDNIRKVTVFLLSNAFTEIILILFALIYNTDFLPFTAVMILWSNLVENAFPTFALAFEEGERDIMERKPIKRSERVLDKEAIAIIFIVGILSDLGLLGFFYSMIKFTDMTQIEIQSFMFALLATNSLFIVFAIKSYRESIFKTKLFDNIYLLIAVVIGVVLMAGALYFGPLQKLLGTEGLHIWEVAIVLLAGIIQILMIELVKYIIKTRESKLLAT